MKSLAAIFLVLCFLGTWYLIDPEFWKLGNSPARLVDTYPASAPPEKLLVPEIAEYKPVFNCSLPPTQEITRAPALKHYTWTDENGVINYSSTPPSGQSELDVFETDLPSRLQYFELAIDFRGGSSVSFLSSRLSAQTTSIYEILSDWIGADSLRQVNVNLVIFPNHDEYFAYYSQETEASGITLANSGGFYSTAKHEAVTFQHPEDDQTITVARHETVHVIVVGALGITPLWLNEGLAEYFGRLSVSNQYQQVAVNPQWFKLTRESFENGYPLSLTEYFSLSDSEWMGDKVEIHYALSWSLVYFLASTTEGLRSLSFIMQELADNYCSSLDSVELLSLTYPGGMSTLEKDFTAWLNADEQKPSHRY